VSSFMRRHDDEADNVSSWSSDDELGRLIRWSLKHSIGAAEPPPGVWRRILDRVQETRTARSARSNSRCSSGPLTSLVQAAVIGCVLLTLGLGLDRDIILARSDHRVHSAPAVQSPSVFEEFPEDVLRGCMLARMEQEEPVRRGGHIREADLPG
jgi:hypothetical protein